MATDIVWRQILYGVRYFMTTDTVWRQILYGDRYCMTTSKRPDPGPPGLRFFRDPVPGRDHKFRRDLLIEQNVMLGILLIFTVN